MAYFIKGLHKYRWFARAIALAGMLVILTVTSGSAGDRYGDGTTIRSITSMADTENPRIEVSSREYFDLVGILNLVDGNRIIIGNTEVTLATGVGTSGLDLYNFVGAKLNTSGEVAILELISNEPN